MRDIKLPKGENLTQLLADCALKTPSENRERARKILKESNYAISDSWGYKENGATFRSFVDPKGTELWKETE